MDLNEKLIEAAEKGDLSGIKKAIKEGANINDPRTIRLACLSGNLKLVKFLENQGLTYVTENNDLFVGVCERGHLNIVKYMIEQEKEMTQTHGFGMCRASLFGNLDVVKYLVEQGVDINTEDQIALSWASSSGHVDIVRYLLDCGLKLEGRDHDVIKWACKNDHPPVIKLLLNEYLDKGVDVNKISELIEKEHLPILKKILLVKNQPQKNNYSHNDELGL